MALVVIANTGEAGLGGAWRGEAGLGAARVPTALVVFPRIVARRGGARLGKAWRGMARHGRGSNGPFTFNHRKNHK